MDVSKLSPADRQTRQNVRNFLLTATREQLAEELQLSLDMNDHVRAAFVRELIEEARGDTDA